MNTLENIIHTLFENRQTLTPENIPDEGHRALMSAIDGLNNGTYRVAEQISQKWIVHEWLKKAVLLYFKVQKNTLSEAGCQLYYDKVPLKYETFEEPDFIAGGTRVVPGAVVRYGAYIAPNTILMPSFVNIGAYVGEGTLIDTWATVGSCAQIGKNVHLSGGVGIGGVLEPLQAQPTIIEDNCFIGARSEVVEGVIVEKNSVIGMGVFLGQSTKIYNRLTGEITYGRVPAGSVVVAGNLPAQDGSHSLYCAVIVKQVDEKTRAKTSLNELLRP
jgi:2,3,4,5-tetrahydropyridine-2-carboxylate N-succinyltransferase